MVGRWVEKWRIWRSGAAPHLFEAAVDNPRIGLGWTTLDNSLRLMRPATLYRLLDREDLTPGQAEAVRWELTRRQGLSAQRVAWAAFGVSVLALIVSIIWHD